MQEYEFSINFRPSIVAISSILCARKVVKIDPIWSESFEEITDYLYD